MMNLRNKLVTGLDVETVKASVKKHESAIDILKRYVIIQGTKNNNDLCMKVSLHRGNSEA